MLLPSALSCDSSQTPPLTRLQSALFASPPASPPQLSTQNAIGNIFSTCRSLQSLLAGPAPALPSAGAEPITPPTSSHAQLPTPPLSHAPLKLRLRSRKADNAVVGDHGPARKRIVKRTAAVAQQQPAPRSPLKRRRALDDDMGPSDEEDDEEEPQQYQSFSSDSSTNPFDRRDNKENAPRSGPHTPKRSRIAPESLPLGLERADYHNLLLNNTLPASQDNLHDADDDALKTGTDVVVETDGSAWSTEEDRILVELVMAKLRLSKSDWQDCARSLGKDRGSVGRRWKSLMINGDVGLKRGAARRARIHGTWR